MGRMNVGATLLTLRQRGRPYDGKKFPNSASVLLAFRVTPAEVDEWHQELIQKQVEILDPPRDMEYGHRA